MISDDELIKLSKIGKSFVPVIATELLAARSCISMMRLMVPDCNDFHHDKKFRHGISDICPVVGKWINALENYDRVTKGDSDEQTD